MSSKSNSGTRRQKTRSTPVVSLNATALIFDKDVGKWLLVYNTKHNKWMPPGGHVANLEGELPHIKVIEKAQDEAGIDCILDSDFHQKGRIYSTLPGGQRISTVPIPYRVLYEEQVEHLECGCRWHYDLCYMVRVTNDHYKEGLYETKWMSLQEIRDLEQKDQVYSNFLKLAGEVAEQLQETDTKQMVTPVDGPIILGAKEATKQWGVIGKSGDTIVRMDLNAPHIVTVFGTMGSGKGYTIGAICEMLCSESITNISQVEKPATVIVLYKPKDEICSEFNCITSPNDQPEEVNGLSAYGTVPQEIVPAQSFRVFVDPTVFESRKVKFREEYKTENVFPFYFDPADLDGRDWSLVLSDGRSTEGMYAERLLSVIENLQDQTFDMQTLRDALASDYGLTQQEKAFVDRRLEILTRYLVPSGSTQEFANIMAIGGVNIFDFRWTLRTAGEDLSLMTLILSLLKNKTDFENEPFAFVINEAHSYFRKGISNVFAEEIGNLIRRKRHGRNWLFLDSQEPADIDETIISLSDIKILHLTDKMTLRKSPLSELFEGGPKSADQLENGEALICANLSSLGQFKTLFVKVRPRLTKHGGRTKTAVE